MASDYRISRRSQDTRGLVVDRPEWSVDTTSYVVAKNVRFSENTVEMVRGTVPYSNLADQGSGSGTGSGGDEECANPPSVATISLAPVTSLDDPVVTASGVINLITRARFWDGSEQAIIGTNQFLYRISDTGSLIPINASQFNAPPEIVWETANLLNEYYFTNGLNQIQRWAGGFSATLNLTGTPPRSTHISEFENHLVLGRLVVPATGNSPLAFAGSGLGNPIDWDTTDPDSDAIIELVPEGSDPVKKVIRLGNHLAIYKEFSIHLLTYIGLPFVYERSQLVPWMGTVASGSVVPVADTHYFIGQDNIYKLTTTGIKDIGTAVWPLFDKMILPEFRQRIVGFHHIKQQEIIWGFRSVAGGGLPDLALVYNYRYDSFSMRDFPYSAAGYIKPVLAISDIWDTDTQEWDLDFSTWDEGSSNLSDLIAMVGDENGNLSLFEEPNIESDFPSELESGDWDGGDENRIKIIRGLKVDIKALTGSALKISIGERNSLDDSILWNGPVDYTGGGEVDLIAKGRWLRFKFEKEDGHYLMGSYTPIWKFAGNY